MIKWCAVVRMVMRLTADAKERACSVHRLHSRGTTADDTIATATEHQLCGALVVNGVLGVEIVHCGQHVREAGPSAGPGAEASRRRRAVHRTAYVSDDEAMVSKRYHQFLILIEYSL